MAAVYRTKFLLSLAVLVLLHLCVSFPAQAEDANSRYVVNGAGVRRCNEREATIEAYGETLQWAAGYLSAFNYTTPGLYSVAGDRDWPGWLREYCRANPTHDVSTAVQALVETFWPGRQVTRPATVLPPAPVPTPAPAKATRTTPVRRPQY